PFEVEQDMNTLRIEADRFRGTHTNNPESGWIHGIDDPNVNQWFQFTDGVAEVRLPAGRYAVQGQLFDAVSPDADFLDTVVTFAQDADLTTTGATLVLHGEPVRVRAETPRKARPRALSAD